MIKQPSLILFVLLGSCISPLARLFEGNLFDNILILSARSIEACFYSRSSASSSFFYKLHVYEPKHKEANVAIRSMYICIYVRSRRTRYVRCSLKLRASSSIEESLDFPVILVTHSRNHALPGYVLLLPLPPCSSLSSLSAQRRTGRWTIPHLEFLLVVHNHVLVAYYSISIKHETFEKCGKLFPRRVSGINEIIRGRAE